MNKAHDILESQINVQKAKIKPKSTSNTPANKHAPTSTKLGAWRGAHAAGNGASANVQFLVSPKAAQFTTATSARVESTPIERQYPKSGSVSANANRGAAAKLTLSAIKEQQFKVVSPHILRTEISK